MPQLPSGRQVAISPAPLVALLDAANQPGNIHKILAIQSAQDLEQYIDVLFFIAEDETCEPVMQVAYRDEALPRPPGMVPVSSGHTLAAWGALTANWSDEDKVAMHDFLDTRAAPALNEYLEAVTKVQTHLRGADDFLTKTLTLWWDAGIHPAQEEGWDESDVGGPQWDTYDLIAALGQVAVQFHCQPELIEQFGSANDLLFSYWNLVQQILTLPPHWPNSSQPIRECANQARECGFLDAVTDTDRQWLRDQGISIAISVWNILGDAFQARFPQPYVIIELVVVSPDANKYFSARHEPC